VFRLRGERAVDPGTDPHRGEGLGKRRGDVAVGFAVVLRVGGEQVAEFANERGRVFGDGVPGESMRSTTAE
jgi:hypothetical protein